MTSLLPAPRRTRPTGEARADAAHRRPLVLLGVLAGVVAAASTLLVCLAGGVVGWFLTDAGAHGAPRDGLRVGALGWLMAHGSGVHVEGTHVTAVPLGLTLLAAVVIWRLGLRLGDSVSGHGPDADAIADGVRDWTVASATALFTAGYVAVAVRHTPPGRNARHRAVAGPAAALDRPAVRPRRRYGDRDRLRTGGDLDVVPAPLAARRRRPPHGARSCGSSACRLVVFLVALLFHWDSAANVMSQLHTSPGAATLLVGLSALLLPNAALFTGSYLLGPGFAVGAHTLVSPTAVVLGPHPVVPVAGGAARHRSHPGLDGRAAGAAAVARRRGGPPHPDALPDDRGGTTPHSEASGQGSAARWRSPSWPASPGARSGPAGWPWSGPSPSRSCSTASRRSASVASSAR